jgi:hypothetical protein
MAECCWLARSCSEKPDRTERFVGGFECTPKHSIEKMKAKKVFFPISSKFFCF